MSIIRNTASGLQKGRVGNTTYYVMNGQQVARQARNNSNYGETASRSYAQQARRVKWSNLVNFYKACKDWMPKAFENKKRSQSVYNKFMSVNINSSNVSLTKDQALNGSAVVEPIIVSQGSLSPIAQEYVIARNVMTSDIELTVTNLSTTPIAQLTSDIIANNPTWQGGDNLALVLFSNGVDERNYPYVQTTYFEFTLDQTSSQPFSSLPIAQYLVKDSTTSALSLSTSGIPQFMGAALIHTRKSSSILQTSTQRPVLFITSILDEFSTQEQLDLAIASYGVSDDVPLDPSFTRGSIVSVLVNGVVNPAINGAIVEVGGAVELVINVQDVNDNNLYLEHDGVRYTPLQIDGNSWLYILGSNGTNRIYLNGVLYGGVEVVGIDTPTFVPFNWRVVQSSDNTITTTPEKSINLMSGSNSSCIQYPHKYVSSNPYFLVQIEGVEEWGTIDGHNCTVLDEGDAGGYHRWVVQVTDNTKTAYLSRDGYIIAVFNY